MKEWVQNNREDIFPGLTEATCAFTSRADKQFEKWNSKFPKATRNANVKAWPLVKRDVLTQRMLRKYTTVKMFLKSEKYDKAEIGEMDSSLAPRCISAWVAFVNVATFALTLFHEYLVSVWGDYTRSGHRALRNVCFPAGMNSTEMSMWFSSVMSDSASLKGFEDDFTLFDSTQNAQTHELLQMIYGWAGLNTWPCFQVIRAAQAGVCRGVSRHGVRYTDVNTMRSGSADTCLGNTIVNYLYHMFALACSNLTPQGTLPSFSHLHSRVRMMVLGDDNVTIVDSDISTKRVSHTINQLGLISKISQRAKPSDCVFLNQWFIDRGRGVFAAMPNFFRLFGKIGFACEKQPDPAAYQYGIAQAFDAAFSGCTIPSTGIRHLMSVAGSRQSPQNDGHNKIRTGAEPSWAVKRAISWDYRVTTNVQLQPNPQADRDFLRRCGLGTPSGPALVRALTSYHSIPCALGDPHLVRSVVALT
jgi:hypothetical protein